MNDIPSPAAFALCGGLIILAVFGLDWVGRTFSQIRAEEAEAENRRAADAQVNHGEGNSHVREK